MSLLLQAHLSSLLQAHLSYLLLRRHLVEEKPNLLANYNKKRVKAFKDLVNDVAFWVDLKQLLELVLEPAKHAIDVFESDSATLDNAYEIFQSLHVKFKNLENLSVLSKARVTDLLKEAWNFMHTESMGFAFILAPKNLGKSMLDTDFEDTIEQFEKYCSAFYRNDEEKVKLAKEQLHKYFSDYHAMSDEKQQRFKAMKPKSYWATYGEIKYPQIAEIARQVFSLPCSNASSERAWNVFDTIHSKKRNRLKSENVDKLAFIYINMAILDENDTTNYGRGNDLEEFLEELEKETEVEATQQISSDSDSV